MARLAVHWRRFAWLLAGLAVANAFLLALFFNDRLAWRWVLVLDWPARLLLPGEAEEAIGPWREASYIWLAALPWLALCALAASLGSGPQARRK